MNQGSAPVDVAFAAELAQLRLHAGLSRRDLADEVGIQPCDVSRSEAGQRSVHVVELFYWCLACGSSLDVFFERMDRRLALDMSKTRH
ncbi:MULTISPECIES: helix-turn-helix transcriptional regulator [unclassified Roseateles]|uniref:helix-turn-helix domain-containing protein n=1 Tax=unclassified Roseateles TaxID=2626991 RepID=UPI0012E375A1